MPPVQNGTLTERQRRELEYHRHHAEKHAALAREPLSYDVLDRPGRRWWNAYWRMFEHLVGLDLAGREVLVVGCGFGEDALRLARLGARVSAFDLSPQALEIARQRAQREGLQVEFAAMPAETLDYASGRFDCVLARDILHHVDIPRVIAELRRVARPGGWFVMNEIYTHSTLQAVRQSRLVERVLYRRMKRMVYGTDDVYITADERKLDERDLGQVLAALQPPDAEEHYNAFVARVLPDRWRSTAVLDRRLLQALGTRLGRLLGGRALLVAKFAPG